MLDSVPISALQHFVFCPRQYALIHQERAFRDNEFTLRGQRQHQKVHEPGSDTVDESIRIERALPLTAPHIGIHGIADVVEFHEDGQITPVEHKVGRRVPRAADDVQVAAQAMALEEMFGVDVNRGWVFHHASRRRRAVDVDRPLRERVRNAISGVRHLEREQITPEPVNDTRCKRCSLIDLCLPEVTSEGWFDDTPDLTFNPSRS